MRVDKGRLKERYPHATRYCRIEHEAERGTLSRQEEIKKKAIAVKLDGSYVLNPDRHDLTADEIRRTYVLPTRVESAFRSMNSPLMERPISHHQKNRA